MQGAVRIPAHDFMDKNLAVEMDKDHHYWHNGEQVPGYSAIIKDIGIQSPAAAFYTKEGSDLGTTIHSWFLFLCRGKDPLEPPDDRIGGKVDAIRKFLADTQFLFRDGEKAMFEPTLRYACTPDVWGAIMAETWVIDLKSGGKVKTHPLQSAAQKLALGANNIPIQHRGTLYVRLDGSYTLDEHSDRADEDAWRAIVAVYHLKRRFI